MAIFRADSGSSASSNAASTRARRASRACGFLAAAASIFVWLERKVSGRIQDRLGPSRLGLFGLPQMVADAIKLLTKEDTAPDVADKFLFKIAPYLAFCASFVAFVSLPFGDG